MLPHVPYPLPTLLAVTVLGTATVLGANHIQHVWDQLKHKVEVVMTDQVPTEADPALVKAPVPRKGLLLRDDVPATERPDGGAVVTIGLRRIVEVLNVWPPRGETTHYRIQVGKNTGWVKADDVLIWDTRLVVRVPGAGLPSHDGTIAGGGPPLPITAIDAQAGTVTLVEWDPQGPWRAMKRRLTVKLADVPAGSIEVFLVRAELLTLIGRQAPADARARAALGRLVLEAGSELDPKAIEHLAPVLDRVGTADGEGALKLTKVNEDWRPDASWNTQGFRGVPLSWLP